MDVNGNNPPTKGDYIASLIIPPYSIIAGIVAMARSMPGPGLALWATGFLGFWIVWPVTILIIGAIAS